MPGVSFHRGGGRLRPGDLPGADPRESVGIERNCFYMNFSRTIARDGKAVELVTPGVGPTEWKSPVARETRAWSRIRRFTGRWSSRSRKLMGDNRSRPGM